MDPVIISMLFTLLCAVVFYFVSVRNEKVGLEGITLLALRIEDLLFQLTVGSLFATVLLVLADRS